MTKAFAIPMQDERTPPPWLVGAFIVLFGVALAAAMPALAAAAGSRAEAAVNAQNAAGERIVVRAKIQVLRIVLPKISGGTDLAQAHESAAPAAPSNRRIAPRLVDLSSLSAERGIKIRAPPGSFA